MVDYDGVLKGIFMVNNIITLTKKR